MPKNDTIEKAASRYIKGGFGKVGSGIANKRYVAYIAQLTNTKDAA